MARRLALVLLAVGALLALGASSALAAPGHTLGGRISTLDTDPANFAGIQGVAVQQSTQDVFVVDAGNGRIVRLDSSGDFLSSFTAGIAPDAATASFSAIASDGDSGDVYVVDQANFVERPFGAVDRFQTDGTFVDQINETDVPGGNFFPTAVAVNGSNGDVYVADTGAQDGSTPPGIDVFDDTGTFQSQITGTGTDGQIGSPQGVAVDNAGTVYVLDSGNVKRFASDGTFIDTVYAAGGAQGIGVDPVSGDLFIIESASFMRVLHYDSTGTRVFAFGRGDIGFSRGVAIDHTANRVWVTDQNSSDLPFFNAFTAPDVTTGPATPSTDGGALTGTVDPVGIQTSYHFEYGPDENYGNSTDETDAGAGSGDVDAAGTISGQLPNTTFHYRLVATNASGSAAGEDQTFTTTPIPPVVTTEAATGIKREGVTFNGTVNPNNSSTTYHFEYGLTDTYGSSTDPADAGAGSSASPQSQSVTGLVPGTEYHFRIVADNGTGGEQFGADQTVTTLAPLAEITLQSATGITQTSAVLHATVDNHGFPSTYQFAIEGVDTPAQLTTPITDLPLVDGPQQVSATVSGLTAGASYQARAFATTGGGITFTDFGAFKTVDSGYTPPPAPLPILSPYGCVSPHLNAYSRTARPGSTITLTGSDLGVGGQVLFGSREGTTDTWSSTSIAVQVPAAAKGKTQV
ncbi:MAG TPA: IPT/TIG domain-containing protein, partial [Thermoleophilaceae bacterium]